MTPVISLDWLTLFCRVKQPLNSSIPQITIKTQDGIRTTSFDSLHYIYYDNIHVGELQLNPHSVYIEKEAGILKITNPTLYNSHLRQILNTISAALNLSVLSVSRLDICCDTITIAGGNLSDFARKVIQGEVCKKGQRKYFFYGEDIESIRSIVSNRENTGLFLNAKTQVRINRQDISYISWGTRRSDVRLYMYNKTQELKQEKDKPYIREAWKLAGWNGKDVVYRIEFSIKGSRLVVREFDGSLQYIIMSSCLAGERSKMFRMLLDKYGKFAIYEPNKRFDRLTPIDLIPIHETCTFTPARKENMHTFGYCEKIAIKRFAQWLPLMSDKERHYVSQFIQSFIDSCDLSEWADQQGIQQALDNAKSL